MVEERRRDALAYVCAHLGEIHTVPGVGPLLEQLPAILGTARDATVDGLLDRLHTMLQQAGDALGVYGNLAHGAIERGIRPVGVDRRSIAALDEVVYLCPADTCSRYWLPHGDASPPRCSLHDRDLRRDRL